MPNKGECWGIMGGIFDPIHYGHLILAQAALGHLALDGVLFLPSFNPPHRNSRPIAPFADRCRMVQMAVEENDSFLFSDLEKDLQSPGYTLAIVDFLNQTYSGVAWHLILGSDNISQFDNWHKPDELVQRVKIAVGDRPGFQNQADDSRWSRYLIRIPMPLIEISSTMIRSRIKDGLSCRYLMPDDVRQYVEARGLYR